MHFGTPDEICQWEFGPKVRSVGAWGVARMRVTDWVQGALEFPARCASECLAVAKSVPKSRALDVGCAVGRSSFELVRPPDALAFSQCVRAPGTTL